MTTATPPAERLLNLVIALMNTNSRLTRRDIQHTVAGYDPHADPKTFERMFERDKDTLRELGVPIITIHATTGHGEDIGYRIDKTTDTLAHLSLNAAEISLLSLAATLWQDTALEAETTRALTKLKSHAPLNPPTTPLTGFNPRLRADDPSLTVILDAITQQQAIHFTYRAANTGELAPRTIQPWQLSSRRGGWYVIGHDTTRNDKRVFRLNRIVGKVKTTGPTHAFQLPPAHIITQAFQQDDTQTIHTATLALQHGRAQTLRTRSTHTTPPQPTPPIPTGYDIVHIDYIDEAEFADEIAALASAALVITPTSLAQRVINHHHATINLTHTPHAPRKEEK